MERQAAGAGEGHLHRSLLNQHYLALSLSLSYNTQMLSHTLEGMLHLPICDLTKMLITEGQTSLHFLLNNSFHYYDFRVSLLLILHFSSRLSSPLSPPNPFRYLRFSSLIGRLCPEADPLCLIKLLSLCDEGLVSDRSQGCNASWQAAFKDLLLECCSAEEQIAHNMPLKCAPCLDLDPVVVKDKAGPKATSTSPTAGPVCVSKQCFSLKPNPIVFSQLRSSFNKTTHWNRLWIYWWRAEKSQ